MKTIERYVRHIEGIKSASQLKSFFSQICADGTYRWAGLAMFRATSPASRELLTAGGIPRALCPVIDEQFSHRQETGVSRLVPYSVAPEDSAQELMLCVPFNTSSSEHGYLILGGVNTDAKSGSHMAEKLGWFWSILVPYLYQAYLRTSDREEINITKRELECIRWASEGKTSWEISQILNISERTANFHLANYIEKTGSVNRQQAIVKCLLSGHLLSTENL